MCWGVERGGKIIAHILGIGFGVGFMCICVRKGICSEGYVCMCWELSCAIDL